MIKGSGNSHRNNAYTNSAVEKLVGNSVTLFDGTFLKLENGALYPATQEDEIEGVSITDVTVDTDNETNGKITAVYKPVRLEDSRKLEVVNGVLDRQDVGSFFYLDGSPEQYIDYNTKTTGIGQFRLESIFNDTIGEFTIVKHLTGPQGAGGPTGPQGPQGTQGPQGNQGPRGFTGPVGPVGPTGPQGDPGIQGLQGIQGIQGTPGLPGVDGRTPNNEGNRNSSTNYPGLSVVRHNGKSRRTNIGSTINQEPGVHASWILLNEDGVTGPQGPIGPAGPSGGPAGPAGPQGPAGLQGTPGPTGPAGSPGIQGPQGKPGPMTDEFISMRSTEDQTFSVPGLTSESYLVRFNKVHAGNGGMIDPAPVKSYMRASSDGQYMISANITPTAIPNVNGDSGVGIARLISFVTDSSNNLVDNTFRFIDQKDGDQQTNNKIRFFNLSATVSIGLRAGWRVWFLVRGSADSVLDGDVMIEGPRAIPGYANVSEFGRACVHMHKINDAFLSL